MHVLYFPLITDDVTARRPDAAWARQIVRDTAEGWRCVLLLRPDPEMAEYTLWERTRDLLQRFDSCVDESADSAYLLAQRATKVVRESGYDAGEAFRYVLLVSDGHKLHFYIKGFRCLLWGVPVEGSPPLRLAQEDKQNVIESRDFPSLQRRDVPQATPFVAEPVIAVVSEVRPDGLLPSFTKTLESLLVLSGPVSLHRERSDEAARGEGATWHLWEEMSNLAAVDLRRLESKLAQLSERIMPGERGERRVPELWRRVQPFAVPGLLALNLVLLLILLFRGSGSPAAPSGAVRGPLAVSASGGEQRNAPPELGTPYVPAAEAETPPAAVSEPDRSPSEEAPPAVAERVPPRGPTRRLASFISDASPADRAHFTQPVKLFVERRILPYLEGEPLTESRRKTMVNVAVQLLTNRRCAGDAAPIRVDGEVGERTLEQIRRCARDGDETMEVIAAVYSDTEARGDIVVLERKVAAALE